MAHQQMQYRQKLFVNMLGGVCETGLHVLHIRCGVAAAAEERTPGKTWNYLWLPSFRFYAGQLLDAVLHPPAQQTAVRRSRLLADFIWLRGADSAAGKKHVLYLHNTSSYPCCCGLMVVQPAYVGTRPHQVEVGRGSSVYAPPPPTRRWDANLHLQLMARLNSRG
jgi:hypothetical protein